MRNIASQETGDRRRKPKECRAILWRSASVGFPSLVGCRALKAIGAGFRRETRPPITDLPPALLARDW
jgi:hypothetical protein